MGVEGRERYVNPYTDFGFKKLFGTELNKDYWDYYSTMKTAHKKGLVEGRAEGRAEGILSVASNLKRSGMSLDEIAKMTGLPVQEIENL